MNLMSINNVSPLKPIESELAAEIKQPQTEKSGFSSIMQEAMETLRKSQEETAQDSYDLALGNVSDLHSVMINSAVEATAVETVVQLTSRAVSAYKEIMQMQI